jgi:Flp pilus assembly protein TadG
MRLLKSFSGDEKGAIAVIFALALVPILGVSGAAIDYARATQTRGKLQAAVDAAAIAALTFKANTDSQRQVNGTAVFQANQPVGVTSTVSVTANNKEATVSANSSVETSFLKVLQIRKIEVSTLAKAVRTKSGPPACVLGLSKTAAPAIEVTGNADGEFKNCVLYSNSSGSPAMSIGGSSKLKADGYCAVGWVSSSNALSPSPQSNCPEVTDPFASVSAPLDTVCTASTTNVKVKPKESRTLDPGVYCGGLDLQGDVMLNKGLYVIKDGGLSMNSQGSIIGRGVTFYLMGQNAGFDINGGANLDLSPMTEGPYMGLLLVQDRNSNVGGTSKLNGNASTTLTGAIYAPTQLVRMNGTSGVNQTNTNMPVVADRVEIKGDSTVRVDASLDLKLIAPMPRMETGARLSQ